MNQRRTIILLAVGTIAALLLLWQCSPRPIECPPPPICPSVDVEARDVQIRALREMDPDLRTEEIATLLEECLR